MARAKKPTNLKIIQGTHRPDRANPNEPDPEILSDIPEPPAGLSDEIKAAWRMFAEQLQMIGVLAKTDLAALEAAASCYVEWKNARDFIAQHGVAYEEKSVDKNGDVVVLGWKKYPQTTALHAAENRLRLWLNQFGMTPASRANVSATPGKNESSPWDAF